MTGTAMTEANEFWKIYNLEVIAIPTNKPLIRVNHPDVIFRTEKEKWKAVIEEVAEVNKTGRPILIGTVDVDKSLKLSEMLKRRGIKHELLNALPEHAAREAEIVAQAGRIARRDHLDQHGRPRHRHHPRRQPRDAGLGPAQEQVPHPPRRAGRRMEVRGRARSRPRRARCARSAGAATCARRVARWPRWAACTSSAPNATRPGASTTSSAAAPAARATPARRASTCRCKTT